MVRRFYRLQIAISTSTGISLCLGIVPYVSADTITVDPNDPNAVNIINQYAGIDGSDIYLTDGDQQTVDTLIMEHVGGVGEERIEITGNSVTLRGEGASNTIITWEDNVYGEFGTCFVSGNAFRLSDLTLDGAAAGILFTGEAYGNATCIIERVRIRNMSSSGMQWNNYDRPESLRDPNGEGWTAYPPAIIISNTVFDSIHVVGAHINSPWATDATAYINFVNCTFNDIIGVQMSVAADLPIHSETGDLVGTFDSCIISGATMAFNESVYLSNSPSNTGKRSCGDNCQWICLERSQWSCVHWELEDEAFEVYMGGGDEGNFVDEPEYEPGTLTPTNPRFFGDNFSQGQAGARLERWFVGDLDADLDVDADDLVLFEECASGPFVPYAPECDTADFDCDNDVDQDDFARIQACFSGSGQLPQSACAM